MLNFFVILFVTAVKRVNKLSYNLIDVAESLANKLSLSNSRIDDNEISILLCGSNADYTLSVVLRPDDMILFACDLDIKASKKRYNAVTNAIVKVNERIWVGHFDLHSAGNDIIFTLAIPFISSFIADEFLLESAIKLILTECEKYYHYFSMVASAYELSKTTITSVEALFLDTAGEA